MAAETKVSLKLLVDTKAHKVLFAEGNKDFVDFLFYLLSLPIGTVAKLLANKGVVGCVADLYESVNNLSSDYWLTTQGRQSVLSPKPTGAVPLLSFKSIEAPTKKTKHCGQFVRHSCSEYCYEYESIDIGSASTDKSGYVKGVVTYMIMDNLEVKPMSTISGITLINKFNVKNVNALVEKQVHVGLSEGLKILKASLETRAVLTNVFLDGTV